MSHTSSCANRDRIVVGVDHTAHSQAALGWAGQEAKIRNTCLHVVHSRVHRESRPVETYVNAVLRPLHVEFVVESVPTSPMETLIAESDGAALLVVGTHLQGDVGVFETSVSRRTAARATCPVAIIDEKHAGRDLNMYKRIVVGVDETASARNALQWAATEAHHRDCEMYMIHVARRPDPADPGWRPEDLLHYLKHEVLVGPLSEVKAPSRIFEKWPNIAEQLIQEAENADMLVVGARGYDRKSDVSRDLSVTKECLVRAPCPVVVAPSTREDENEDVRKARHDIVEEWSKNNPVNMDEVVSWLEWAIDKTMEDCKSDLLMLRQMRNSLSGPDDSNGVTLRLMTLRYQSQDGFDARWPPYSPEGKYSEVP